MKRKINPNLKYLYTCLKNQKYDENEQLISGKRGVILEGSSRCFSGSQEVITKLGVKKISNVTPLDEVLTYNEEKKVNEYKLVNEVLRFKNTKLCYKIKLKDGTIIETTEDHEFYYKGEWIAIKDIISLWNENSK